MLYFYIMAITTPKSLFYSTPECLRTIQVINVRWFNATAWYALELSRLLIKAGHKTLVLTLNNTETHYKAVEMGLSPIPLPLNTKCPFIFFKLIQSIYQQIKVFKPNIVNCHRGEAVFLWGILRKKGNYALVRTRGDQRLPKRNIFNKLLYRSMTDAIITTNTKMSSHITSLLNVKESLIDTIIGGVDNQRFYFSELGRRIVRSKYGFTANHFVIGLLGRFDRKKKKKELINAIALLIQEGYTSIRLLLIGFPTTISKEEVEVWIKEAKIEPYVIITGYVQSITDYLSAMDLGVIASLSSETIARAALEIIACKRPLISTNVGVMPDLLPLEALVEPGNILALKKVIQKAIVNSSWRKWLVDISSNRMKSQTSELFLSETLESYSKALSNRFHAVYG